MLPSSTETPITPLPTLPMSVLSITILGEYLSSNVSLPFMLFMVKGFGFSDEADAAFWTGILVAMFFLSQFLTSLLWATLAERYGRRLVLVLALFGSAVSVGAFGLSKSITQAICIRLVQGVFAGVVGVARGSVVFITDASNEGRAYALLGFFWDFGGFLGLVIGGSFERPAERWPIFHQWRFLTDFPYLLPSVLAGLILLAGSILACFLGRDGGSRGGIIPSHPEKIEIECSTPNNDEQTLRASTDSGIPLGHRMRTMSTSTSNLEGNIRRRGSKTSLGCTSGSVNSIADLQVAAALNVDENPFEGDDGTELGADDDIDTLDIDEVEPRGRRESRKSVSYPPTHLTSVASNQGSRASQRRSSRRPSTAPAIAPSPLAGTSSEFFISQSLDNVSASGQHLPSNHANTVNLSHQSQSSDVNLIASNPERDLPPILESRRPSVMHLDELLLSETTPLLDLDSTAPAASSSPSTQIPGLVIAQFGLLALHTTTHEQVYMSYLASAYEAGGLGLTPSDFAQLNALMAIAQPFYQFYLYPNVGPPRGRLSHLTMYRLGTSLFIPAYLTVVLYRIPFGHADGSGKSALMTAIAMSTAVRYCAMTFSFTSISVLLNHMTPSESVGYANGLAQTIVSLARCLGPVLGGWLWSISIVGHPSGYPCGFIACAIVCGFAAVVTYLIRR